jgi:hypothetical protein
MEQRFLSKVNKTDGCWLWTGRVSQTYGYFDVGRKGRLAHRVAYELYKGPISDGLVVRHKCDESKCVNPEHLETGTQQDNVDDCIERGRRRYNKGEKHHNSKLTDDEVREIRILRGFGFLIKELAERYNVSTYPITSIVNQYSRKNII